MKTKEIKKLTEEQFDKQYKLVKNHLEDNASFDGNLFETYSPEIDFVLEMAKQNRVITILECDSDTIDEDGDTMPCMYYSSGYHLVNRIGYLITTEEITEEFEVFID